MCLKRILLPYEGLRRIFVGNVDALFENHEGVLTEGDLFPYPALFVCRCSPH